MYLLQRLGGSQCNQFPKTILILLLLQNDMTPLMVACQSGDICSQAALILITHGARVDGLPNVCAWETLNVVHATMTSSSLISLVPRPIRKIGEKGLVSTVYACA